MRYKDLSSFLRQGAIFSVKKDSVLIAYGKAKKFKKYKKNSFFVSNFDLNQFHYVCFEKTEEIKIKNLSQLIKKNPIIKIKWKSFSKKNFRNQFLRIQKKIQEKEFEKIVPYVITEARYLMNEKTISYLLKQVLKKQTNQWIYGFWNEKQGFLGLSPELLFKKKNKKIKSFCLAGTGKKNENLLKSTKLKKEHFFVLKAFRDRFRKIGSLKEEKTKSLSYKDLSHLKTNIEIRTKKNFSFLQMLRLFHPTASLGSFPLNKWKKIKNFSPKNRNFFGAPFAYLNQEDTCLVSIRGIFWKQKKIMIPAGCGIIRESKFIEEYKELVKKIRSVKKIFKI